MVKQVGLLTAGCQPWNSDVVAASGDRFIYCATLAIYVYQLDRKYNEFRLVSIMSDHKKTITGVAFNPRNPDIIVSSGADKTVIVWNLAEQKPVAKLENSREVAKSVSWCFYKNESVSFIFGRSLQLWMYNSQKGSGLSAVKEASGFNSDLCIFRWHPKNTAKVVLGHFDGSISVCVIGGSSSKHVLHPEEDEDPDELDPVTALEWDPLSDEYLITANSNGSIRLVDSKSLSIIVRFHLPSVATSIRTFSWVNSAPGMFVTGDEKSGVLRIWNVSKSSPIETIKIKKTGFHALQTISDLSGFNIQREVIISKQKDGPVSSTSLAQAPSMINSSHFALPQTRIVCTFQDGGVGLYDLSKRKWNFLRDQGHIETIFDCKFQPDNPDHLATASFDGTIKVWDIRSMKAVKTSPGNEGVVYSISWAPSDLNCIVAGTNKNGIFIWNIEKDRIIKRFMEHGKSSVFSVAWNQKDSKRIMSVGADNYCIVRLVNGEIFQKYKHPATVYGCDWSPNNKDMLATGCEDKCVRVYYLAASSDQPLKIFTGHTSKVFHVRWSPLRDGILCSGSDDGTIRVWDYTQDACVTVLKGHEGPVRGLLWNFEVPYLLISGSWDYTIRIWDTRDGACVDTLLDHGADVYGLTCHPLRPFLLASCSRDSTVRLWSLSSLVQPIEMNVIAGKPWTDIIGTTESAMALGNPPLLAGKTSKDLRQWLESSSSNSKARTLEHVSKFFSQPVGTDNLWELVSVVKGIDDTLLSQNYSQGIMHVKHLTKYKSSEAQELEMVKMSRLGIHSKEDKLREAAKLHIKLGNIQRYCEIMVELGEWLKALSVAPAVSMEYWKSLTRRYATYLAREDSDDVSIYSSAIGDVEQLTDFYTSQGQLLDAVVSAQVACEGAFSQQQYSELSSNGLCNGDNLPTKHHKKLLEKSVNNLAEWYFDNGSPIMSACCYLSINNNQKALWKLIQGQELELAVAIGTVLGNTPVQTYKAIEYLSRRCEHLGKWELAVDLLKLIPDNDILLAQCCSRCAVGLDEINFLHERAGLPSLEDCFNEAEKLRTKINTVECIKFYLLCPTPETGLELGVQEIKKKLSTADWTVDDVFPLIQLISSIRSDRFLQHKLEQPRNELLCIASYIGALMAVRRGYHSIIPALFSQAIMFIQKFGLTTLPVSEDTVVQEKNSWVAVQKYSHKRLGRTELSNLPVSPNVLSVYNTIEKKAGSDDGPYGQDCVASSHLPSHSDVHVSCITGQRVLGLAFFLEDGRSAVSPNESLMWAKVNPFSPLGSGLRLNPF